MWRVREKIATWSLIKKVLVERSTNVNITNSKGVASISLRTERINDDTNELDKLTGSTSEERTYFWIYFGWTYYEKEKNTYRSTGRIRSGIFFPVSVN